MQNTFNSISSFLFHAREMFNSQANTQSMSLSMVENSLKEKNCSNDVIEHESHMQLKKRKANE